MKMCKNCKYFTGYTRINGYDRLPWLKRLQSYKEIHFTVCLECGLINGVDTVAA